MPELGNSLYARWLYTFFALIRLVNTENNSIRSAANNIPYNLRLDFLGVFVGLLVDLVGLEVVFLDINVVYSF